ncbi:hypothetical protein [Micromonospora sp. Llam0]|uniref:hypothetical protein n=1 Tax=Micromonospora sp. Llam0 TaxID=2485143 RepID=UPI0011CE8B1F|nr:hypothetical protein [Micromonospora sp. Llam0]
MPPPTDGPPERSSASPSVAIAGGAGAMAACCTVHLLIVAGVLAGLSGAAIGGIALAVGLTTAATVWAIAVLLRRRTTSAACRTNPAPQQDAERYHDAEPQPRRRAGYAGRDERPPPMSYRPAPPPHPRHRRRGWPWPAAAPCTPPADIGTAGGDDLAAQALTIVDHHPLPVAGVRRSDAAKNPRAVGTHQLDVRIYLQFKGLFLWAAGDSNPEPTD